MKTIYLIGALKNWKVITLAKELRTLGFEVFDDWISPGPEADNYWRKFEKLRGSTYKQALNNYAAKHIFEFDKFHLDRCDIGILLMPAGKSGHLELGYLIGQGKRGYILFDKEPKKWDIMYKFCNDVFFNIQDLIKELKKIK